MENDSLNEHQDFSTAQDGSFSSHSRAENVSNTGLPPMPRHRSLLNLPRARKDASAATGSSVNQLDMQLKEMERARAHETQVNAQLDASKKHWQQLRKAYRKSRIQYENAIDPFGAQPNDVSTSQTIAEQREHFINDRSALESYAADVRAIKRKLEAAQSSRSLSELAFMQSAHQWTRTPIGRPPIESHFPLDSAQQRADTIVPAVASPSEIGILLERYRYKQAAVNSLGERLADHNYEYWNEVARRELLRDREETLSVGDDEFEELSEQEKNDILQELSKAREEEIQLKADCASAGADVHDLDPRGLTFPYSSDLTNIGYEDGLRAALARIPTEAFKDVENVRGDMSENESAHSEPDRDTLVTTWMKSADPVALP
jgi:hypothetical protein